MAEHSQLVGNIVQKAANFTQYVAKIVLDNGATGIEHRPVLLVDELNAQTLLGQIEFNLRLKFRKARIVFQRALDSRFKLGQLGAFFFGMIIGQRLQIDLAFFNLNITILYLAGGARQIFTAALDDDLNVSAAWGAIFDWVRDTNKALAGQSISAVQAAAALAAWDRLDTVLGLGGLPAEGAPPELLALLAARQAARLAKDFKKSDAIRDELKAKGWVIEDTPKGPRLKKA